MSETKQVPHCSSCGKSEEQVFKVCAGISANICNICIRDEEKITKTDDRKLCSICNEGKKNDKIVICPDCLWMCRQFIKEKFLFEYAPEEETNTDSEEVLIGA